MARKTRESLIDKNECTIVHTVAKTARDLFLLGDDFATNTRNSHRKDWIIDIMEFQNSLMAIDLLAFCLMNNHVHLLLRSRPDAVKEWDDLEVARRWMTLCPKSKKRLKVGDKVHYVPIAPKETQIQALAKNAKKIATLREQLSSISWYMRLLCQKVAQRANFEDGGSKGPFWKGRFHSTVIDDASYLLGSCFYIDLNAFKAFLTDSIDGYAYTSAKIRLDMLRSKQENENDNENEQEKQGLGDDSQVALSDPASREGDRLEADKPQEEEKKSYANISRGEFLSQVKLDTYSNNPQLHTHGFRCSDKGFLEYSDREYLDALEWCIRNKVIQEESKLPEDVPDCLKNNPLGVETVLRQARDFGRMYRYRAGTKPEKLEQEQEGSCSSPNDAQ